ncbi:hypothetical protein [Methylotenera sp. G11]|uniref:hypothetical protein n=1 Tax=Methylotenera sp. G11 TaxID=1506585 RepID=UPI0006464C88|nr:hypothetical protein [Methylotenera sp. G11]
MNSKNFTLLICSLILSCACSSKPLIGNTAGNGKINAIKTSPFKQSNVSELLAFIDSYSNLTPEMQKKTFAEINQAAAENKNILLHRLKLASMFALPSSRLRDNAKAQNLLQDLLQENTLHPSDAFLLSLLYEYTTDYTKQLQRNRDDMKKLETAQQKYEALELKNKVLEQKLNELKNIEKTMNDRDSKSNN